MSKIEPYITSIPDFPEPGVIFRDITTAIGSADGLQLSVDEMAALLEGEPFDVVAGLESAASCSVCRSRTNCTSRSSPSARRASCPARQSGRPTA